MVLVGVLNRAVQTLGRDRRTPARNYSRQLESPMRQLNEAELLAVSGGNCPDDWPTPDIPTPEIEIPTREPDWDIPVPEPEPEPREPEGPPEPPPDPPDDEGD